MSYITHADLGGKTGFGPVTPQPEGQPFHAGWEQRVLALTLAMGATGSWNIDMSRAARETLPLYRELSYYQIWLAALEKLLQEHGLAQPDELAAAQALYPARPVARVLAAADVAAALAKGAPTDRPATVAARFAVGQTVRAYAGAVPHHTRLPAYARGKCGRVECLHGMHVFADANALGLQGQERWLYTVVFEGAELWADAVPGLKVSIDAWEPYLEAA